MEIGFSLPGDDPQGRSRMTYFNVITPRYFATLGVPLVAGRELLAGETDGVVVNAAFAARQWPGQSALGRSLLLDGRTRTVVGVARDANYVSLNEAAKPTLYLPHAGDYMDEMTLHVRTAGDPAALARPLARAVEALDPSLPLPAPTTLFDDTRISLLAPRIGATLLGAFGGLALLLAAVGIYGVVSFTVVQRTREIGIRAALGATRAALLRLVVRGGVRPVAIGTAVGMVLAVGLAFAVRSMLFGVSPLDPSLVVGAPIVLLGTAALASLVPARRAARVDPLVALRAE
jgi:predicted permease